MFDSVLTRRKARLSPGDLVQIDGRPVRLKVHASARRVSLRLDVTKREVVATAPSIRRLPDALAFAQSRTVWIAERLDTLPRPLAFTPGDTISLAGAPCRLERAAMRIPPKVIPSREGEPARLLAYGDGPAFARAVERGLRAEALKVVKARTAAHAAALGAPEPQVSVMDARARWGSCMPAHGGAAARIRYAWRLVMAPPWVLDYVAAHECAHLVEANHGPRFWAVVQQLYGDPAPARAWLKQHGARLHGMGRG
ncbi:MAG TPA: YgjP-like metallopeptidase domain-containing protein [Caulobacteraceae bacterium]|jgi:predicted metal-dependent hydrolase|nr:YgjP-like metallopeptidase domain-containing protein [Caulobacteraceae bacterium]